MLSNRLAFAALAIACLGAAAGGGYLATRQTVVPAATSAQQIQTPSALVARDLAAPSAAPAPSVQETEAIVGDRPAKTPAPVAAPSKTTAKRAEPPARVAPARETRASGAQGGQTARHEPSPTLTSSWPSSAASQPPAPVVVEPPAPHGDERALPEHTRAPEPPQKTFDELVISADSVIGLQTENRVSSESARIEDRVDARVTRDLKVGDRVAIPAGSRAIGSVMQVDRGGKFKERARLGIRFHTLVLADGTRVAISTETIFRDGDAPGNSSAAKVGGAAVGGAILGAILGGGKGAAIGATAGAGAGSAAVMAGDRNAATLPSGTPMTVRILSPVMVTVEK
jgi:hypothetical protein